jgi:hypothetical protein
MMPRSVLALALACMLCASLAVWSATAASLPKEHHRGALRWMSGGVGKDQADAMRAVASRYNVLLVMAEAREPSAAFLAAVPVSIGDAKGHVLLRIKSAGPLLFLHLPPDRYKVKAKVAGRTLSKSFAVKSKGTQQITLIWPMPPGEH